MKLTLVSTLTIGDYQKLRELRALRAAIMLAPAPRDPQAEVNYFQSFLALADLVNECVTEPVDWANRPDSHLLDAATQLIGLSEADAKKSAGSSEPPSVEVSPQIVKA